METNNWAIADRISDCIVETVNGELEQMKKQKNIQPLQLLAGQLLAFKALESTMPLVRPQGVDQLFSCVDEVLKELFKIK